jgi:hypothetical protein
MVHTQTLLGSRGCNSKDGGFAVTYTELFFALALLVAPVPLGFFVSYLSEEWWDELKARGSDGFAASGYAAPESGWWVEDFHPWPHPPSPRWGADYP